MKKLYLLIALIFLCIVGFWLNCICPIKSIKIEKTYLINLDRSTDRLKNSDERLSLKGIKYERFKAIEGLNLKIIDSENGILINNINIKNRTEKLKKNNIYKVYCSPDFIINYHNGSSDTLKEYKDSLSLGELGAQCSHLSVIKKIADGQNDYVLIMEDDFTFKDNFEEKLKNILNNMPQDCEMLYLYHNKHSYYDKFHSNKIASLFIYGSNPFIDHIVTFKSISGNVAYIMTKSAAKKIIEYVQKNGIPNLGADHFLSRDLMIQKKLFKGCLSKEILFAWDSEMKSTTGVFHEK